MMSVNDGCQRLSNGDDSQIVRNWFAGLGAKTLYIEPGSPWENGYCESFNRKLRDECLNGEIFYSLKVATIVIEQWRKHYNTRRPHSSLNYRPPAPQTSAPAKLRDDVIISIPLVQPSGQLPISCSRVPAPFRQSHSLPPILLGPISSGMNASESHSSSFRSLWTNRSGFTG
jgi:hypothetical protein